MATQAPARNGRARTPRVPVIVPEATRQGSPLKAALLEVQKAAPKLRRDEPGHIGSRTYMYASLYSVLDDVNPLLFEQELLWTAKVTLDEGGQPAALYRMEHVPSREHDEWLGPLPCIDSGPQALGSAITYMRRYTLVDYLNLAPGEDDDGAAASIGIPVDRYAEAEAAAAESGSTVPVAAQPTAKPAGKSERPATAKQRNMLEARARAAGLDAGAFANVVIEAAGDPPREWRSEQHAAQTLGRLLDRLPAKLVTAVKDGIGEGS